MCVCVCVFVWGQKRGRDAAPFHLLIHLMLPIHIGAGQVPQAQVQKLRLVVKDKRQRGKGRAVLCGTGWGFISGLGFGLFITLWGYGHPGDACGEGVARGRDTRHAPNPC